MKSIVKKLNFDSNSKNLDFFLLNKQNQNKIEDFNKNFQNFINIKINKNVFI